MRKLANVDSDPSSSIKGFRQVYFASETGDRGMIDSTVYDRSLLPAGAVFTGPAIVEEPDCTTVIHPEWKVTVDQFGNLSIEH